jgi:hypothetical protein
MLVTAAPGLKVPKEFHTNRYITDAEPVEVIESVYYQRRIDDGDLVVVKPVKEPK